MRKKLLLADDSITIQKVVELTFPSDEFEVVTAGNGRLAVDKALAFLPDIVLCDVIMPQLDGYQVCEALRASAPLAKVPILLLNGAFEPYDAERAKSVGALGNVSKPFDPPALVARVKEILNERSTAAFQRPSVDDLAGVGQALVDNTETVEAGVSAATVPHDYTYDESETHPVSTVEVPMDVREMAARSLSLDAPVFAPAEPEVLTSEEPALSDTIHGPLDAEAPPVIAAEVEAPAPVEEMEAIEEIEPVAATGEFEAPAALKPAAAHEEPAAQEPMEFDPESAEIETELPAAPAPALAVTEAKAATAPAVEEFGGEHEFDPSELDNPVAQTAEVLPTPPGLEPEPEPASVQDIPFPEPAAIPMPAPPQEAIGLPAPPPAPVLPEMKAPMPPAPSVEPEPAFDFAPPVGGATVPAQATMPAGSAEVAVPVDMVQQIAQRVISQVSERVIREIAWDVIPGLAEKLVRAEIERIKARAESERD